MSKPDAWERLEAARKKRLSKTKGNWAVMKVNDNGKKVVVTRGLSEVEASRLAGRMRDAMEDRDVGRGWNYLPRMFRNPRTPRAGS